MSSEQTQPLSLPPRKRLLSGAEFNNLTKGLRFARFFSKDMTHRNYVWQLGKNILKESFNPHGTCQHGGLYFSTIQYLYEWFGGHSYIGYVTIPDHAQVWTECGYKYKSDIVFVTNMIKVVDVLAEFVYIDSETGHAWLKHITAEIDPSSFIFAIFFCRRDQWPGDDQTYHERAVQHINKQLVKICKNYHGRYYKKVRKLVKTKPSDLGQYELIIPFTLDNLTDILRTTPDNKDLFKDVKHLFLRIPEEAELELVNIIVECRYNRLINLDSPNMRVAYVANIIGTAKTEILLSKSKIAHLM